MKEEYTRRSSLTWIFFLVVLLTTQLHESEATISLKLKKLLKKVLLLKALTGKKGITIIPIPIPLNLFMKDKMKEMEKIPQPMPYPMHMMEYGMMMMPKDKGMMMPSHDGGMMASGNYGMMGGD